MMVLGAHRNWLFAGILFVCGLFSPAMAAGEGAEGQSLLTGVSVDSAGDKIRIILDFTGDVSFVEGSLKNPNRFYLDLQGTSLGPDLGLRVLPVDRAPVSQIRVGQFAPDTARIVLDLKAGISARIEVLPESRRLVLEITEQTTADTEEDEPLLVSTYSLAPVPDAAVSASAAPPASTPTPPAPATIAKAAGAGSVTSTPVLSGVVLDMSGASVQGAAVTVRNRGGKTQHSEQTDAEGRFQFRSLTPGRYEIEVARETFKKWRRGIRIGTQPSEQLTVTLDVEDLYQQLTVSDSDRTVSTEVGENLDVVALDEEMLSNLPVAGGDVMNAIRSLLGPEAGGSIIVDGVETAIEDLPASAIESVKINSNPYSAEYSSPGSGRIEIRTRRGSERYRGSFTFTLADYRFDARNAFASSRPEQQARYYAGYLSGPLSKDKKLTFSLSANRDEQDQQSIIFASDAVGIVSANILNPVRTNRASLSLGYRPSRDQSLDVRYSFTDWTQRNAGIGGFVLPESGFDSASTGHSLRLNHRAVLTPTFVSQFSARTTTEDVKTRSRLQGVPMIVVQDSLTAGGAQADRLQRDREFQFSEVFSWSHGEHLLKFGASAPNLSRRRSDDLTNRYGIFNFSSLDDYLTGRAYSFTQQVGDPFLAYWQKEINFFVEDEFRLRPNLSLALGVRYDWQNFLRDHNNFAPRFSVAYAPGAQRKTVLRGGAGLFYMRTGEAALADRLRFDGSGLRQVVLTNPGYPDPLAGGGVLTVLPQSIVLFDPTLQSPYIMQYSLGIENQVWTKTVLSINYTGTKGVSLFRSRDLNAPTPGFDSRPEPDIAVLRQIESSARSERNSVSATLRGQFGSSLSGMVQYEYGRSYDDTSGIGSFPANNFDLSSEWSRSGSDARHNLYFYGSVQPWKLFNLGVVASMRSEQPYSLTTGRDDNLDSRASDRPTGVPRNSLEGFGWSSVDLRWSKQFSILSNKKEGPKVDVGVDAFNVLNTVNFTRVVGNLSSPFFGRPVTASTARTMQVYTRFQF